MKRPRHLFAVDDSGKVSDETINAAIERLAQDVPGLDEAAATAQLATFRAHARWRAYLAQAYEGLGLSIARVNTLRLLYLRNDRRLTMSQLSAYLEASLPSTMRLAEAMEAKGWLQRCRDERDRRLTYVELTPRGEQLAHELLPVITTVWAGAWRSIGETDRRALIELLARLRLSLLGQVIGYESLLPFKMQARRRARRQGAPNAAAPAAVEPQPRSIRDPAPGEEGVRADPVIEQTLARLREELHSFDESAVALHLTFSRAFAVLAAALSARYELLGLSLPRFNTLHWLYHDSAGKVSVSELAAYIEASLPTTLRMARILEDEGWLLRTESDTDRRVTFVELVGHGRQRFLALLPSVAVTWSELWSPLNGEEKRLVAHLMSRLRLDLLLR